MAWHQKRRQAITLTNDNQGLLILMPYGVTKPQRVKSKQLHFPCCNAFINGAFLTELPW